MVIVPQLVVVLVVAPSSSNSSSTRSNTSTTTSSITITVLVVNFHSLEAVYACVLFLSTNSVTASRKTSAEGAFDNKLVSCLNIVLMSSEFLSITAPV